MKRTSTDGLGIVAVIATYVYFLLYAQFGFIHALTQASPEGHALVQRAMAFMGVTGIVVSIAVGYGLQFIPARKLLLIGFTGAGLTALAATQCATPSAFMVIAIAVGGFTGMMTVALAANLRSVVRGRGFGTKIGTATGIAYFICNIPALFESTPSMQGMAAAVGCLVGAGAAWSMPGNPVPREPDESRPTVTAADCRGMGFLGVAISFLALVWLDSAAFATIQETAPLKGHTWGSPEQKLVMGSTHLVAAIVAGWLFDRGHFRLVLLAAFALFAVSLPTLSQDSATGPLYAAGVSFYSVLLVLYPSARADAAGAVPARWRAALLYGVAGWVGSALGVGMAQELNEIPLPFLWGAGAVILLAGAFAMPTMRRFLRCFRLPLAFGATALVLCLAFPQLFTPPLAAMPEPQVRGAVEIARGRRVYIEEGCINCHSQYIRPGTADSVTWGPHRDVDFDEQPPLIGNRRQGPDLMNVGNRRNADWLRIHLIAPAGVSPGSKMPSYHHLFAAEDTRGDDLVAYLGSLGDETLMERVDQILAWSPSVPMRGSAEQGKALFQRRCLYCHGLQGNGDGPLSKQLFRPVMNLNKGPFYYVPEESTPEEEALALARIVKFGIPDTPMAGHEYFGDRELAHIVAYLQTFVRGTHTDDQD